MIFHKKNHWKIAVLGAGSFGTALALTFSERNEVSLWGNEPEVIQEINEKGINSRYTREALIPKNILATTNLEEALINNDFIVFAVPSQATREVAHKVKPFLKRKSLLISVAKGLEEKTGLRMSQVLHAVLPANPIVVLSGPSHAEELAQGIPTTAVVASRKDKYAKWVQESLVTPIFRIYTSKDVVGMELGGVLKNIIALAAGINDGLNLGANSKAALMTRGLVEIIRFGKKMGASPDTFLGLSGLGDLIVTCTSNFSRNWNVGYTLGKGKKLEEVLKEMNQVAEGVKAARVVHEISQKKEIEMPITNQIYSILFENKDPKQVVKELMTRSIRSEKLY